MNHFGYNTAIATRSLGEDRRLQPTTSKTIPFDYVFQFDLLGKRGNKVQDVVEISTEGNFVALSVGYSLVADEKSSARTFQPVINERTTCQIPVLVPLFNQPTPTTPDLKLAGSLVTGMPGAKVAILLLSSVLPPTFPDPLPRIYIEGRIESNGRAIISFTSPLPPLGSVLRVWDRTNNLLSQAFRVGANFQTAGPFPSTPVIGPDPETKRLPAAGDTTVFAYGTPKEILPGSEVEVLLFKSTTTTTTELDKFGPFPLVKADDIPETKLVTGRAPVPLDPSPSLSPGDVLFVRARAGAPPSTFDDIFSMFTIPPSRPISSITLGELEAGLEKSGADLTRGFRLNPDAANLAAADLPLDQLSTGALNQVFETGCVAAEEVSFLYSLDVGNTGREYQSKPIHNIAGLGIANGDRPFRPFAKPVMFEPRSFVRIQVEEISGPKGTLFIVLQGYKMLGTGRIPG